MRFNSAFKVLIWEDHLVVFKERGLSFMDGNMEGRKKNMHGQLVLEPSHRFVQDRGKTLFSIAMAGRRMCKLLLANCPVNKQ
jgi:hypothetical protein